jgi:hypothetical protein
LVFLSFVSSIIASLLAICSRMGSVWAVVGVVTSVLAMLFCIGAIVLVLVVGV